MHTKQQLRDESCRVLAVTSVGILAATVLAPMTAGLSFGLAAPFVGTGYAVGIAGFLCNLGRD